MHGKVLKFSARYPDASIPQECELRARVEILHLLVKNLASFAEQANVLTEKAAALVDAHAKAQTIMDRLNKKRT